jgi:hypothetical protein
MVAVLHPMERPWQGFQGKMEAVSFAGMLWYMVLTVLG